MFQLPKAQRREIARLAGLAHERELAKAAAALERDFERWRKGEIHVFELNESIHKFHNGISRELFKKYCMGELVFSVAAALGNGVLKESEVEAGTLQLLRGMISLAQGEPTKSENA